MPNLWLKPYSKLVSNILSALWLGAVGQLGTFCISLLLSAHVRISLRSCVLRVSSVKCRLIPLFDPWSTSLLTLNWHIDRYSDDFTLTLDQHYNWQSVDSWPGVSQLICIDWHWMACLRKLVDSWLTIDWVVSLVPTEYWVLIEILVLIRCWSRVDRGYQSTLNCRWSQVFYFFSFSSTLGICFRQCFVMRCQKLWIPSLYEKIRSVYMECVRWHLYLFNVTTWD